MTQTILIQPLTRAAFQPYGDVISTEDAQSYMINNGKCRRFHDLARVECTGPGARTLINIFRGEAYGLPLELRLVERHPLGSQAFYPLSAEPFLVIVCGDAAGCPARPEAFLTRAGQGVNIGRNVWHGVLTPLTAGDFLVVDRGGEGNNLEEHVFDMPFTVRMA